MMSPGYLDDDGNMVLTPRWRWEKSGEIVIFAMEDKLQEEKIKVIRYIKEMLKEFSIGLNVVDGNLKLSGDLVEINKLLQDSLRNNKLYYEVFIRGVRKLRETGKLSYGTIIIMDKNRYEFYNPPAEKKKAIFGIGINTGLVILMHTHKESVRHEFAHMFGLDHHKPPKQGCIMNWECPTYIFCEQCKQAIKEFLNENLDSE